ncbi:hypothetical protein PVK06_034325 [Gossypium arboreum]|uniref:Reverse transcriptase domain-containing protein n=1 Tax=Gossypium arboreum TaxID=29729 RepID=A0ABR0NER7_GOSAR|nr:hypothetical protein PVK06_034325 [Gossypium arboreum]
MLKQHVVQFFKELYIMNYVISGVFPCRGKFLVLSYDETMALISVVSDKEICRAVFSMAPLKAPGMDGFQASFFHAQWEILGPSVYSFVRNSLGRLWLGSKLNRMLLVCIPKILALERITQFRPISLCSVVYKILTKTIVTRLRPMMMKLISLNQSSFILGRDIVDNIIVAQEVVHS